MSVTNVRSDFVTSGSFINASSLISLIFSQCFLRGPTNKYLCYPSNVANMLFRVLTLENWCGRLPREQKKGAFPAQFKCIMPWILSWTSSAPQSPCLSCGCGIIFQGRNVGWLPSDHFQDILVSPIHTVRLLEMSQSSLFSCLCRTQARLVYLLLQ